MATTDPGAVSLPVSSELRAKLDRYAQLTGRSLSDLAAAAVEEYLTWRIPQLESLGEAIRAADRGEIATDAEVEAVRKKWGYEG